MKKVLSNDIPDYIGFKRFIDKFDDMVFDKLEALFQSKGEEILFEYGRLINDYTIRKLSNLLWYHNRQRNPTDIIY